MDDTGLFADLVNKERKRERAEGANIRFTGKFHDLIDGMRRNLELENLRRQNKRELTMEFDDHKLNFDINCN